MKSTGCRYIQGVGSRGEVSTWEPLYFCINKNQRSLCKIVENGSRKGDALKGRHDGGKEQDRELTEISKGMA